MKRAVLIILTILIISPTLTQADHVTLPTITLYETFFTLSNKGEENDNIVIISKLPGDHDIQIILSGMYYTANIKDDIKVTLYDTNGEVRASTTKSSRTDPFMTFAFTLADTDPNGIYYILLDNGPSPSTLRQCCITFDYKITYQGLAIPPVVIAKGNMYDFRPAYAYLPVRSNQADIYLSFYATPGEYAIMYHRHGDPTVLNNLILYQVNGQVNGNVSMIEMQNLLRKDLIVTSNEYASFEINNEGLYSILADINPNAQGPIIGFKLLYGSGIDENIVAYEDEFIPVPLYTLHPGNINFTDTDLSGTVDQEQNDFNISNYSVKINEILSSFNPKKSEVQSSSSSDSIEVDKLLPTIELPFELLPLQPQPLIFAIMTLVILRKKMRLV